MFNFYFECLIQLSVANSVEFIQQKKAIYFDRGNGSKVSEINQGSIWSWLTILVGTLKHLCFIRNSRKCNAYHNGKISSNLSLFSMECFTKICYIYLTENRLLKYRRLSEDLRSLQKRLIWVRNDQHLGYVRNMNASSSCLKKAE